MTAPAGGGEPSGHFSRKRVMLIVLTATLLWSAVMGDKVIDDAFITFANARTFAHGYGMFLQPGNNAQSASSALWAIILAPFTLMDGFAPAAAKMIGALFYAGSLLILLPIMVRLPGADAEPLGIPAPIAALMLAAVMAPFGIWSLYGMENGLVAFLLLMCVLSLALAWDDVGSTWHRILPALPITLLYMSRPEAFGLVAILALWDAIVAVVRQKVIRIVPRWLIVAVVIAAYHVFGLLTYGAWLPTSATAKLGPDFSKRIIDGLKYSIASPHLVGVVLLIGAFAMGVATLGALLRVASLDARESRARGWTVVARDLLVKDAAFRLLLLITMLLTGQLIFILVSGGDWMPFARFASHMLPLVACVMTVGVAHIYRGDFGLKARRRANSVTAALLVALVLSQGVGLAFWLPRINEMAKAEARALNGLVQRLNPCSGPETIVAVSDIGRVAWGYRGRVLDWWGLADKAITAAGESLGHIRPETILGRRPDYVVLYSNAAELRPDTVAVGLARVSIPFVTNASFLAAYTPRFSLRFGPQRWHVVFQRADEIACPPSGP